MRKIGYAVFFVAAFLLFGFNSCSALNLIDGMEAFFDVLPGETVKGRVRIQNNTKNAENIKIYSEDYLFYSDGTNQFPPSGTSKKSNGKWLQFAPERIDLQPGEQGEVSYSLKIPENGTFEGSFWSMIMIEAMDADDPTLVGNKPSVEKTAVGIKTLLRYGFQVVTTFKGSGKKQLKFKEKKLARRENVNVLEVDLENTGSLYVRPKIWAEIFNSKGVAVGKIKGGERQILPECSVRFSFELNNIPPGNYKSILVVDTGDSELMGDRFNFEVK